jgi:hypothetical protein
MYSLADFFFAAEPVSGTARTRIFLLKADPQSKLCNNFVRNKPIVGSRSRSRVIYFILEAEAVDCGYATMFCLSQFTLKERAG